jgi:type I restriction enzyme S subunit
MNGYPFRPEDLGVAGLPVVRIRQLLDESAELDEAAIPKRPVFIDDGDLVLSWSATLAARMWNRGRALLNQHLFRVDPKPGVDKRWLLYVLDEGMRRLEPLMHGSAMTHITIDMLRELTVRLPTPAEQRAIADSLDGETRRIDKLIVAKRRAAGALEARRRATMQAGVAGQLTHSDFKASSIAWLPTIPPTWREVKLNLVGRLGSGHTPSRSHPEWWVNPSIPWVTTGEVEQLRSDRVEYIFETREMISKLGMANSAAPLHPAGTVVLCRTASAGYSAIMGRDMATSQDFATWTCGPLIAPRFLLLCLRVMRQDLLGRLAMGSTHQTIYMPDIASIKVPLPPLDDQHAVIEAVYQVLPYIDRAITALDHQSNLLRERRQAVITAAVAGQLTQPEAVT